MFGEIIEIARYSRDFIITHQNDIFVFGDNMLREGFGGQAQAARGCPNVVGIPTKWAPHMRASAFFTDNDYNFVAPVILGEFHKLKAYRRCNYTIWWPKDGVGTGRARLHEKAPSVYNLINDCYNELKKFSG